MADPGQRIRATVIGASQFTVQVSGKTIFLPDTSVLPVHNIPVVQVAIDLSGDIDVGRMAAAIRDGIARMDLDPGIPPGHRLHLGRRSRVLAPGRRRARDLPGARRRSLRPTGCCC